jgi:diguanylate cyclase (GGDEF)-like protein
MTMTIEDYQALFDHSPVSLWVEDYSAVKEYLENLRRQGVADLDEYLTDRSQAIEECIRQIEVVDVNQYTLALFGAATKEQLLSNLGRVFGDEMHTHFRAEMLDMWAGKTGYEGEGINYSLDGQPIDIYLRWTLLPGYETTWARALISIVDITQRKRAERALAASEAHARGLFEHSPISLWVEDYSAVKNILDMLRSQGVEDLRNYIQDRPQVVQECMSQIRVLDVNEYTLTLFGAKTKQELLTNLDKVFRGEMEKHFMDELVDMWNGHLHYEGEGINYSLTGVPVDILLRWSVMPGYEESWDQALISIIDITARKKAETYLKYLGTHDVLTGLYNRAYFEEELHRLEKGRQYPISMLAVDLNGLKPANDNHGHEAGDALLRRAAEVLKAAFRAEDIVARIGGDEFVVLMLETDEQVAGQIVQRLQKLITLNNQFYQGPALSMAMGTGTGQLGQPLASVLRQADDHMYIDKRQFHQKYPSVTR